MECGGKIRKEEGKRKRRRRKKEEKLYSKTKRRAVSFSDFYAADEIKSFVIHVA